MSCLNLIKQISSFNKGQTNCFGKTDAIFDKWPVQDVFLIHKKAVHRPLAIINYQILIQVFGYFFAQRIYFVVDHGYQLPVFINQEFGKIPFNGILNTHFIRFIYQVFK